MCWSGSGSDNWAWLRWGGRGTYRVRVGVAQAGWACLPRQKQHFRLVNNRKVVLAEAVKSILENTCTHGKRWSEGVHSCSLSAST